MTVAEGNYSKMPSLEEAARILEGLRAQGKTIVHCHGVFDLLHPGHILHLKAARAMGDVLVVSVTPDQFARKAPGRPYFNQRLRVETLAALEHVNYAVLNRWDTAIETIKLLKPHIYVKGPDYKDPSLDLTGNIQHERQAVELVGGRLVVTEEESFSSSALLNQFFSPYPPGADEYLKTFRQAHSSDEVLEWLRQMQKLSVLVVGEAILDQYCYCRPMAKPPKDHIVASRYVSEENFAGGSAAIANHLANFCKQVTLVTTLGDDGVGLPFFRGRLASNIKLLAVTTPGRPTIRKQRFLEPSLLTKLFEMQYLEDDPVPDDLAAQLCRHVQEQSCQHDLTLVADFGHGMVTPALQESLYNTAFLAVCAQTNSANMGFNPVTKYRQANYVCIDEPELRLAARSRIGEILLIGRQIQTELNCDTFMVSRGVNGSILFAPDGRIVETPVFSNRVVDRTGAGDALFSVTAPLVRLGAPLDVVGFVGNCVGMFAVETVGNREPVNPVLLNKFVTHILK